MREVFGSIIIDQPSIIVDFFHINMKFVKNYHQFVHVKVSSKIFVYQLNQTTR